LRSFAREMFRYCSSLLLRIRFHVFYPNSESNSMVDCTFKTYKDVLGWLTAKLYGILERLRGNNRSSIIKLQHPLLDLLQQTSISSMDVPCHGIIRANRSRATANVRQKICSRFTLRFSPPLPSYFAYTRLGPCSPRVVSQISQPC